MNTIKHRLSRRTLLTGSGVALALPWLDSLAPRRARAQATSAPQRLLYWLIPNGVIEEEWNPAITGELAETDLPRSLRHLADAGVHRHFNVLSGLDNLPGNPDGFGDHGPGVGAFLTCTPALRDELYVGVSADQLAAQALGDQTPLPSLELSMQAETTFCDRYPCPLGEAISWSDAVTPRPGRVDPLDVWGLLTGGFAPDSADAEEVARRVRARQSVLDYVRDEATTVHGRLGVDDKIKLDQYMTSVRSLENRLAQPAASSSCVAPEEPPAEVSDYAERFALMLDLQLFALECDLTRIVTFMFATAFGPGGMPYAGVPDNFHGLTHAESEGDNLEKILQCIDWEVQQIAGFVARCSGIAEGDGTLLDHLTLCVSSDVGRGSIHSHHELPVLLAGHATGWPTGRHIHFEPEDGGAGRRQANLKTAADRAAGIAAPNTNRLSNLHITLLESMGVPDATLGDSNATLTDQLA